VYLDSEDKVPDSALEQEHLNTRDNLKIVQDLASKNRRAQHWITIERQIRVLEKRVEVWQEPVLADLGYLLISHTFINTTHNKAQNSNFAD
jgi:hypothetical protein